MGAIGIIIALIVLCYFCLKNLSPLWAAPICALIVAFTNGLDGFTAFSETYMGAFADFAKGYLMVFLLGGIFGKLMEVTGAANAIGEVVIKLVGKKRSVLAVILACAIMTYGGISLFIVMFVMWPIAAAAFRDANVPRQLFPGAYAVGCYTFTMTALPGSPQIQNLIPTSYFGTTPMAAPVLGIIASILFLGFGIVWMNFREKQMVKQGIGWTENPDSKLENLDDLPKLNKVLAFLPLVTVIIVLNALSMDATIALTAGIIVNIIIGLGKVPFQKMIGKLNEGAIESLEISLITAAIVGFGAVVKETPTFNNLADAVFGMNINPLIIVIVAVNLLCGICFSASGGMSIALATLGDRFIAMSQSTGIPLQVFHRITSISSGGMDTLPPGVIALLRYCGCSYKESYLDIFMTSVLAPIVISLICALLASFGVC